MSSSLRFQIARQRPSTRNPLYTLIAFRAIDNLSLESKVEGKVAQFPECFVENHHDPRRTQHSQRVAEFDKNIRIRRATYSCSLFVLTTFDEGHVTHESIGGANLLEYGVEHVWRTGQPLCAFIDSSVNVSTR